MKKPFRDFFLVSLALFSFSGFINAQSKKGSYTIKGSIPGVNSGKVYLSQFVANGTRDSTLIKNGKFSFAGELENPMPFVVRVEGIQDGYLFFAENKNMSLTLNKDSMRLSKFNGSDTHKDYLRYEEALASYNNRLIALSTWSRSKGKLDEDTRDSVSKAWEAIDTERKEAAKQFIKDNPTSTVSAFAITRLFLAMPDVALLESLYNNLDKKVQQTSFGREISEKLEVESRTAVGKPATDFTQNDTLGKPVALKDFKGKYVLLDFWASWCGPCRAENPTVVAAYNKYKDKGFDILAVSLDDKKESWLKAIRQDQLTWTHVSELHAWNNSAAKLYGVNAIPSNFLLDPKGIIVGKNLDGKKLESKLEEIFKK